MFVFYNAIELRMFVRNICLLIHILKGVFIMYQSRFYSNNSLFNRMFSRGFLSVRRVLLFVLSLIPVSAVIILTLFLDTRTVNASSNSSDRHMYKYFTSITVHADDTLWDYASRYSYNEKHNEYVSNIMHINNMTNDTIYSGQDIIIYYYSDELK